MFYGDNNIIFIYENVGFLMKRYVCVIWSRGVYYSSCVELDICYLSLILFNRNFRFVAVQISQGRNHTNKKHGNRNVRLFFALS